MTGIYGVDAFRYFLMREMTPGRDASFSQGLIDARYQADLANDLGNLLRRLVSMIGRYHEGRVPAPGDLTDEEATLKARCETLITPVFDAVDALAVNDAMAQVMDMVGDINGYLERTAPWSRAKAGERARVATILFTAAEALRLCASLLHPVMPAKMAELVRRLGVETGAPGRDDLVWGRLAPGSAVAKEAPLFPRDVGGASFTHGA
jgi:methionyl-tRNA synthetase